MTLGNLIASCWATRNVLIRKLCKLHLHSSIRRINARSKMSRHRVNGWNGRINEVLFLRASAEVEEVTVYFGGDVQDFEDEMKGKESEDYKAWSYEKTSELFQRNYPNSCIVLICPSRKHLNIFNFFDNFVQTENDIPQLVQNYDAIAHLSILLKNLCTQLECNTIMPTPESYLPIRVIGFSKGCTVLNQMAQEIHYLSTRKNVELPYHEKCANDLVSSIKEICWIDSGHIGTRDVWITNADVLYALSRTGIAFQAHVSPYQVGCQLRPWIGREFSTFTRILKALNVKLIDKVHFEDEKRSLDRHFELLRFNEL